jgi:nicotinamide-nucleotide amidase
LQPLIDGQTDPTLATYAKEGECSLRIASRRATQGEAEAAVAHMQRKVEAIAGKYLFSDADEDLHLVVARKLMEKGVTLASAESCTGGLFSAKLVEAPGISAVFHRGFVVYSNAAKTEELGVPTELIEAHGAVSEAVAVAMARGAKQRAKTEMAVAVTGIAGPEGGSAEKPVGLVWICVLRGDVVRTRRFIGRDRGRNWNRQIFVLEMMNQVHRLLCEDVGSSF